MKGLKKASSSFAGRSNRYWKSTLKPILTTSATRALSIPVMNSRHNWNSGSFAATWKVNPMVALGLVLGSCALYSDADNCGIVGVVGSTEDASGFVIEGLTILRNRGYDSAGLATISSENQELLVTKFASRDTTNDSIDLVRINAGKHAGHVTGIGHTRWATHGGRTDSNAHPHTDQHHRIAVIHNGTINNSYDLKKELMAQGVKFSSETDTEVIAQLIGVNLDKGLDTKDAVAAALSK
jgi:glucosamine--fructose-6-phosphate aminotransferase (isomerizing)